MSAQPISYISKIWSYYTTLNLWFLPSRWSGWRITVGFWVRATRDKAIITEPVSASNQLIYKPLPDGGIRLLLLQPGKYSDPLVGNLEEAALESSQGTYMALSYTWGMPDASRGMSIDGSSLVITPNLEHALRRLRSAETVQRLWVDFICINQSDYHERNTQVSLMTKIYSWAKFVPCWLGDSTPDSTIGMEILSYLAGDLPFDEGSPWNRYSMQRTTEGLRDVLGRSYFSRIWVVQEAALASCVQLQVGDHSITWEREKSARLFLARIKLLEVSPSWRSTGGSKVDMRPIRELLEQSVLQMDRQVGRVQNATLLDVVHSMRFREFTNPMDSIYGIMGLVSPAEVAGFVPDYSQSWEETYKRFYEYALNNVLKNPEEKWDIKNDSPEE